MTASGFAFSWFGIAVVAAVLVLVAWTVGHFVRRRIARRRGPEEIPVMVITDGPAVRQPQPAAPAPIPGPAAPAVRRTARPVAAPARTESGSTSQPVVTDDDLATLWGPVVPKERPAPVSSVAAARSTADQIARDLADTASAEEDPDDAAASGGDETRVIVIPDAVEPEEPVSLEAVEEERELVRVIQLDPQPEEAAPEPARIVAESFPESVATPGELPLPSIAAATGSEGRLARPRLTVLPRRDVVEEPGTSLTPAAVDRRARVALDMLHDGPGRTGARVEVALDVLHTVKANLIVNGKVEEAYEAARKARDRQALAPLALALAAVGSPAAPAALLRAYATAPDALADSLLTAIRGLSTDELKANRRLVTALPPERRAAVRDR